MGMEVSDALVVLKSKLSPHLDKASAALARLPFFRKRRVELEPEERLAVYLRLRAMKRKMGLPGQMDFDNQEDGETEGVEYEGPVIRRDADIDSGGACGSCDSGNADARHGEGDAEGDWRADEKDRADGGRVCEVK